MPWTGGWTLCDFYRQREDLREENGIPAEEWSPVLGRGEGALRALWLERHGKIMRGLRAAEFPRSWVPGPGGETHKQSHRWAAASWRTRQGSSVCPDLLPSDGTKSGGCWPWFSFPCPQWGWWGGVDIHPHIQSGHCMSARTG